EQGLRGGNGRGALHRRGLLHCPGRPGLLREGGGGYHHQAHGGPPGPDHRHLGGLPE
ncbi:unnamed protein product, partial [Effrenium voratum]